jgi:hypothetical protein
MAACSAAPPDGASDELVDEGAEAVADAELGESFAATEARLAAPGGTSKPGGSQAGGGLTVKTEPLVMKADSAGIVQVTLKRPTGLRIPNKFRAPIRKGVTFSPTPQYEIILTGANAYVDCHYYQKPKPDGFWYRQECFFGDTPLGTLSPLGEFWHLSGVESIQVMPDRPLLDKTALKSFTFASYGSKNLEQVSCSINSTLLGIVVGGAGLALSCNIVPGAGTILCSAPAAAASVIAGIGVFALSQAVDCDGVQVQQGTQVVVAARNEAENCEVIGKFTPREFTAAGVAKADLVDMCLTSQSQLKCATSRHFPCYGDHINGRHDGQYWDGTKCKRTSDNYAARCLRTTPEVIRQCVGNEGKSCGSCRDLSPANGCIREDDQVYCKERRCYPPPIDS